MIKPVFILAATMLASPALAQTAAPAAALPMCSAKVTDACQQTSAQEARAMSGDQADRRDARNAGNWTPNGAAGAGATGGRIGMLRGKLAAADTDHDGVLTSAEWTAAGWQAETFTALDLDGDGSFTKAEYRAVRDEVKAGVTDARAKLAAADSNGDGAWSKEEWAAAGFDAENFAALDTNKNGSISKAEMRASKAKALKVYDQAMATKP